MRKLRIVTVAVLGLLAFATVAFAVQENTYSVSGSTSPTKAGTKTKPVPVAVNFGYKVGEKSDKRPGLIEKYNIKFAGLQVNTNYFKGCSAEKIESEQTDSGCPKGSLMGTGSVRNIAGATADENDKSQRCYLDLKVYNSRNNKAALVLSGAPNDPRGADYSCVLEVFKTIDANFIRSKTGVSLQFTVSEVPLLHPVTGFDNAVIDVNSKIRRATVKKKGRTRGFFESVGGCRNKKRAITVTFTPLDKSQPSQKAQRLAPCKK